MSESLQQRIGQRRQEFGASVGEMASWSNLPEDRWRAIEAGESLNVVELGLVARALAVDPGTLLRGEEGSSRRSVARFRQAAVAVAARSRLAETRTLALAAELGRMGGGLHRLLGRPLALHDLRQTLPIREREEPWEEGYRLGAMARTRLGIPVGPITDVQATLEALGVHIATLPFSGPDLDAASLMEEGSMPILLLNQPSPRVARTLPRRATVAHELCHLLHDAGEQELETRLSYKENSSDGSVEQRARAFAPAFLAPPEEVRHWFRSGGGKYRATAGDKVLELAKRWGLSWRAAAWHAKNCALIPAATARNLIADGGPGQLWERQFERRSAGKKDYFLQSIATSPLCRGRLAEIVAEAYEAGAISRGRAREILTWG